MPDTVPSAESTEVTGQEVSTEVISTNAVVADASQAESSTANDKPEAGSEQGQEDGGAQKPKTVLEAAKAGLDKAKGAASPAEDTKDQKPKTAPDGKQPATKPEGDVTDTGIPKEFHKHPAWIRIAQERDANKEGAAKWERFNELVQAGGYGETKAVEDWLNGGTQLNQAGVSAEERGLLLEFGVAAKTNPERAFEIVAPIYNALREVLGDVLPSDLQKQVDEGELSEEAARRVAKSEASKRIADHRTQRTTQQVEQDRQVTQDNRAKEAMATAVVSWEQRQSSTNPDWERVASAVSETVANLRAARNPRTPEDAVKLCDDALQFVMRTAGLGQAAKPNVTIPQARSSTRQQAAAPKSAFEAAKLALGR